MDESFSEIGGLREVRRPVPGAGMRSGIFLEPLKKSLGYMAQNVPVFFRQARGIIALICRITQAYLLGD